MLLFLTKQNKTPLYGFSFRGLYLSNILDVDWHSVLFAAFEFSPVRWRQVDFTRLASITIEDQVQFSLRIKNLSESKQDLEIESNKEISEKMKTSQNRSCYCAERSTKRVSCPTNTRHCIQPDKHSVGKHYASDSQRFLYLIGWEYGTTSLNQSLSLLLTAFTTLTVVWRAHSFSRLQNAYSFAISFIFRQPATAWKYDRFLIRCGYFNFLQENAMSRSTTFVPNAYFVDLNKPQKTEIRTLTQVATNSFFFSGLETNFWKHSPTGASDVQIVLARIHWLSPNYTPPPPLPLDQSKTKLTTTQLCFLFFFFPPLCLSTFSLTRKAVL